MPIIYKTYEPTDTEREILSAITAIEACDSLPTQDAIAEFMDTPKSLIVKGLRSLKQAGLVQQRRLKQR